MICLICGKKIGSEFPIPVAEIRFTPIISVVSGITENKLGQTVLTDRLCCQDCYEKIQQNDFKMIQEAGRMPRNAQRS
jgi:hypothetical protein